MPEPGGRPSSPWVWPLRVVGVLAVAVLVGLGATSLVVQFFVRESVADGSAATVTTLDVSMETGSLTVDPAPAGEPLRWTARSRSAFEAVRVDTDTGPDGTLRLRTRCPGTFALDGTCTSDLVVTVPSGTTLRLVIGTGDIRVTGTDGDLTARSATGDVSLARLAADRVEVQSAAGDIGVRMAAPPTEVRARSAVGDVSVVVPADGTTYQVRTGSAVGRPDVRVPQDPASPRVIDVSAAVGDVTVRAGR